MTTFLALHSTGVHHANAEWKQLHKNSNWYNSLLLPSPNKNYHHDHGSLALWQHCFALTWSTYMTDSSKCYSNLCGDQLQPVYHMRTALLS